MHMCNRNANNQYRDRNYLHLYYTYTLLVRLLVIYIPITYIYDWSLYCLFTSLLQIYMTGLFTGYLHPYYTYTCMVPILM
jgi:hypothetical protein